MSEKTIPDLSSSLWLTSSETSPNNTIPILYHNTLGRHTMMHFFCFSKFHHSISPTLLHISSDYVRTVKSRGNISSAQESIMHINEINLLWQQIQGFTGGVHLKGSSSFYTRNHVLSPWIESSCLLLPS